MPHVSGAESVIAGMGFILSIPDWAIWLGVGAYFSAAAYLIWKIHD